MSLTRYYPFASEGPDQVCRLGDEYSFEASGAPLLWCWGVVACGCGDIPASQYCTIVGWESVCVGVGPEGFHQVPYFSLLGGRTFDHDMFEGFGFTRAVYAG